MNLKLCAVLTVCFATVSGCAAQDGNGSQSIANQFVIDLHQDNLTSAAGLAKSPKLIQFGITSKLDATFLKSILTTDTFTLESVKNNRNTATVEVKVVAPNMDRIFPQLLEATVTDPLSNQDKTQQKNFIKALPKLIRECPKYSKTVPLYLVKTKGEWRVSSNNTTFVDAALTIPSTEASLKTNSVG